MRRRCARPGCADPATVTLAYDYEAATVWLGDLDPEGHPMTHDLCERHGARTVPPRGWDLVDQRRAEVEADPAVSSLPVVDRMAPLAS